MSILRIRFEGFNRQQGRFADCFLLIRETSFTTTAAYDLSLKYGYPVCSPLFIDRLVEKLCKKEGGQIWDSYVEAASHGHSFTTFAQHSNTKTNHFAVPRFSEEDFSVVITALGGFKIPETIFKTPDFFYNNMVLELKDLQTESLYNRDRQNSIGRIFKDLNIRTVDLNPALDYGGFSNEYRRLIANTIQNHFKKASEQIKSFKKQNQVNSAGIILLNTGMFSLPHKLLCKLVEGILQRLTKTIEFTFIFSQVMQTNGFDVIADFQSDFIGKVPPELNVLREKVNDLVEEKMTDMIINNESATYISSQEPISFRSDDKIFYWNPGRLEDSRIKEI